MRSYIVVLFLFTSTYLFSQNKTLDSLYAVLNDYPTEDSIKIDLIFKICRVEFFGSNKVKVVALSEEGLALSKKVNYTKGEGFAYNYLALYYQSTGDFDKVADNGMKMAEVYERSKNDAGLARAYSMLSLVHQQWKNYDKAESYLKKALEINQKAGHKLGMAVNYMNLGVTLGMTGNYDSAINYFIKALALRQELGDEKEIANAYTNLGYAYVQKKDSKRALQNFEKAYPLALKTNNLVSQFEINIGLLKIYATSDNYQKSATYAGNSLALAKELN